MSTEVQLPHPAPQGELAKPSNAMYLTFEVSLSGTCTLTRGDDGLIVRRSDLLDRFFHKCAPVKVAYRENWVGQLNPIHYLPARINLCQKSWPPLNFDWPKSHILSFWEYPFTFYIYIITILIYKPVSRFPRFSLRAMSYNRRFGRSLRLGFVSVFLFVFF